MSYRAQCRRRCELDAFVLLSGRVLVDPVVFYGPLWLKLKLSREEERATRGTRPSRKLPKGRPTAPWARFFNLQLRLAMDPQWRKPAFHSLLFPPEGMRIKRRSGGRAGPIYELKPALRHQLHPAKPYRMVFVDDPITSENLAPLTPAQEGLVDRILKRILQANRGE